MGNDADRPGEAGRRTGREWARQAEVGLADANQPIRWTFQRQQR
ncbi:hypothetical protein V474_08315 [Novosphingobium barchaimii LL02]|uniref:Uncharacterized protein n=1 Tax=Novosphingobium barchaimii LL02 TaxID=1114963 RepID=A0A0J8B0W7_9SPHN|nr:hypothetical protein [Novosphingobium barchaimii]KMS60020.1 hypothetical protein V474_08315 [Novosphingobium barchaimii LL02]